MYQNYPLALSLPTFDNDMVYFITHTKIVPYTFICNIPKYFMIMS